jgi:hypothetical protein
MKWNLHFHGSIAEEEEVIYLHAEMKQELKEWFEVWLLLWFGQERKRQEECDSFLSFTLMELEIKEWGRIVLLQEFQMK